jgi:hypothetical protein
MELDIKITGGDKSANITHTSIPILDCDRDHDHDCEYEDDDDLKITTEDDLWNILDDFRDFNIGAPMKKDSDGILYESCNNGCDMCGSLKLIIDDGANICTECKCVQSRVIDTGAEWRYYGADDSRDGDPARCGMPTNDLLPKSSIGSIIGGRRGDNRDIRRIRMFQMWNSMPYWERTLYNVFDKLSNNTSQHGIPTKVLDDAKVLYKKQVKKNKSR